MKKLSVRRLAFYPIPPHYVKQINVLAQSRAWVGLRNARQQVITFDHIPEIAKVTDAFAEAVLLPFDITYKHTHERPTYPSNCATAFIRGQCGRCDRLVGMRIRRTDCDRTISFPAAGCTSVESRTVEYPDVEGHRIGRGCAYVYSVTGSDTRIDAYAGTDSRADRYARTYSYGD